jgi:hypothetical protein
VVNVNSNNETTNFIFPTISPPGWPNV